MYFHMTGSSVNLFTPSSSQYESNAFQYDIIVTMTLTENNNFQLNSIRLLWNYGHTCSPLLTKSSHRQKRDAIINHKFLKGHVMVSSHAPGLKLLKGF